MDLLGALPAEVILEVYDVECVHTIDYEHIPFICCNCHEHGHLFKEWPLNKREKKLKGNIGKDPEGYTKVVGKVKGEGKKEPKET